MASASAQSLSINMVLSTAVKGANFLQMSVNGIKKYATSVEKISLLKATKFSTLNRGMNSLENHLEKISLKSASISANPIRLDIKTSRDSLKEARKDMTAIEHDAKQVAFWTKKAGENLKAGVETSRATSSKPHKKFSHASSVAKGVATAGVVGTVASFNPIRRAIDFESDMADVTKATNATKEQTLVLKTNILSQVNKGSLIEPSQMAQIQASGGRSGVSITDLPQFTDMVSKASIALDIKDYGVVARDFSKMAERMNVPISKVDVFTNSFTALENSGSNSGVDMINTTARLSNRYKMLNFKPQNASAISNYMNTLEVTPELAASSFQILTDRMIQTNNQFGYFDRLKTQGASSLKGIIKDITSTMNNGQIIKAFGTKGAGIITAMSGNFKTLDKSLAVVGTKQMRIEFDKRYKPKKVIGGLDDYMSAVDNEYKVKVSTTGAKEVMALNRIGVQSIYIGDKLKGYYIDMYDTLSQVTLKTISFYEENRELVNSVGATVLKIGALALGLKVIKSIGSPFVSIISGLWKYRSGLKTGLIYGYNIALKTLSVTSKIAGGALRFLSTSMLWIGRALLLNPIGLTLSAIAGAGYLIYSNWETIKSKAGAIWSDISSSVKKPFVGVFDWIESKFLKVMQVKNSISSFFGFGDDEEKDSDKVPGITRIKEVGIIQPSNNILEKKSVEKEKSFFESTKEFFGFKTEQKSVVPGIKIKEIKSGVIEPSNNTLGTSLLKEKSIREIPLQSVSAESEKVVSDTKSFIESKQINNNQGVNQTITNHITVHTTDGRIDEEELYEQIARVQKRVAQDELDMQVHDVPA